MFDFEEMQMSKKLGYIDGVSENGFMTRIESIAKKLGALVNSIGNKEGQGLD